LKIVRDLFGQVGFDTVNGGRLDQSWRQKPGTPAYCTDYTASDLKDALAKAVKGKAAVRRDYFVANMQDILAKHSYVEAMRLFNTDD
jgi:hypothetical protein